MSGRRKDHTRAVLSWLESYGRRVVNGRRVLELEMSKVDQMTALRAAGIDVPRTVAVSGTEELAAAAGKLPTPFVTKHNQGGKGLGVRRFDSYDELVEHMGSGEFEEPQDGITLVQEYIRDETKTALIKDALQEDNIRGMHTFDQHLVSFIRDGVITLDAAIAASTSPHDLTVELRRLGLVA